MLQIDEAIGIDRILDELAAVGVDGRLVDAAEAAGGVDLAREEREVLGQVRQMHLGQLRLALRRGST